MEDESAHVEQLKADVERLSKERDSAREGARAMSEKISDWENLMTMLKDDRDRLEADVSFHMFLSTMRNLLPKCSSYIFKKQIELYAQQSEQAVLWSYGMLLPFPMH